MDITTFNFFSINNLALTIVFSVISCIMGVEFSRLIKIQGRHKQRKIWIYSTLLALSFLLTHLFVIISVEIPFSLEHYYLYFFFFFLFCMIGSYAALHMAQKDLANIAQFIITSILIGSCIIGADYTGFSILFQDTDQLHPVLFSLAVVLTLGTSFSLLRFLMQITNEEIYEFVKRWKYLGCTLGGLALSGIPYMVLTSMVAFPSHVHKLTLLLPFIFMASANLLFLLVPDLFGERLLMKHVQSNLSLFNHNPDAVFKVNLKGNIVSVNKQASVLTGYEEQDLIGLHFSQLIGDQEEEAKIRNYFTRVLIGEKKVVESSFRRRDQSVAEVRITAVRIIVQKQTVGVFGIVRDITERKKAEQTINHLAYHDELTNLPNRRNLEKTMDEYFMEQKEFSLIYLDFDRFKKINDTFGHSFGDKVLVEIGNRLLEVLGNSCMIARIGGDEFAVVAPAPCNPEISARKIVSSFQNPILVEGMEFLITSSIGIASYPEDTDNSILLLQYADMAMYKAKENGANQYRFFDKSIVDQSVNKFEIENDLRNSINNQELMVFYQPKYNVVTNEITGAEALARWNHSRHGMVSPSVFIPIAEEANLIVNLERMIIRQVCSQLQSWKMNGVNVPRTSINISMIHFYQEDFYQYIEKTLEEYEIEGNLIEIEVTESIMIKKDASINEQLQALRKKGIEVSIDDFGTGYSSLSYLSRLSVDRLKIDQSFISNSQENREIISTIVSMARNLKLNIIAEGVETEFQIDLLKSLGCNEVQGYFFSPPLPSNEYEQILNESKLCLLQGVDS